MLHKVGTVFAFLRTFRILSIYLSYVFYLLFQLHVFLLQFLNIKILMLGIAFYSGYILPYGFHPGHIVAFALVMALCAGTGNLIWATLGSLLFPLYSKYARAINTVMALLLVWCAWKIIKT